SYPGNGIYVSPDGGENWEHRGLEHSAHIGKIVVDPEDSDRIFVAAAGLVFGTNPERGVYRTLDGGENWERVFFLNDSTGCIDVAISPGNSSTVFAVMWERLRTPRYRNAGGESSGIWRSLDGGDTWTQLTDGFPDRNDYGRGGIAISPSNPDRIYAVFADHPGYLLGLFRSDNGGDSWQQVSEMDGTYFSSFGWYFGQLAVDPLDEDVVYALGVECFKSVDGGENWEEVFRDAHVDHHAIWIDPSNTNHVIIGHDGGINLSFSGGNTSDRFINLPVSQFYSITVDPSNPQSLYGGTQDNSTLRTIDGNLNEWDMIYYGDGFHTIVDPEDSELIYAEYQYGHIAKSDDGGWSWEGIFEDFINDRTNWNTPYIMHPEDNNTLLVGTYRVWRTENQGNSWSPISQQLSDTPDDGNLIYNTITTMAFSQSDPDYIYVGTDDANIWMSANSGESWNRIDNQQLPDRWVTAVVPHPDSSNVVYVTFSGYHINDQFPYIFRSSDFGLNWYSVHGNLPSAPVNDLIIDPENPATLVAATDFGVYYRAEYNGDWSELGEGLPLTSVFDLHFIQETREIIAGTHGYSMWSYPLELHENKVEDKLPQEYNISLDVYPNPFNQTCTISVNLPGIEQAELLIFNINGRLVFNQTFHSSSGINTIVWDGLDNDENQLPSGSYMLSLEAGRRNISEKIFILR
ncbi:T9SS type A sorting domain-containing protein, partial [bacterium]|nr:T9SS type A sorting domain-containing protein [bacterium]